MNGMNNTAPVWEDPDALVPDGWQEGDTLETITARDAETTAKPETPSPPEETTRAVETPVQSNPPASGLLPGYPGNLTAELEFARRMFPDMNEIPGEVYDAVAQGNSFLNAYSAYRTRETARELEQVRRENALLRHNQELMRRAPVRGVSGGGSHHMEEDAFLRGFYYDDW